MSLPALFVQARSSGLALQQVSTIIAMEACTYSLYDSPHKACALVHAKPMPAW